MKLGILVNTDEHADAISGIVRAALARGHQPVIFAMDAGVRLLEEQNFVALADLEGVSISYCEHSSLEFEVKTEGLNPVIERSSQYSNAEMNHNADKVLVL